MAKGLRHRYAANQVTGRALAGFERHQVIALYGAKAPALLREMQAECDAYGGRPLLPLPPGPVDYAALAADLIRRDPSISKRKPLEHTARSRGFSEGLDRRRSAGLA